MSVNEDISSYSTTAASNSPQGTANIGTDLDDHIRDIKKNIRTLSDEVSAVSGQVFLSAGDAIAFVSVGAVYSVNNPLTATGTLASGTIGLAQIRTATSSVRFMLSEKIDPWGRVTDHTSSNILTADKSAVAQTTPTNTYVTPNSLIAANCVVRSFVSFNGSGSGSSVTIFLSNLIDGVDYVGNGNYRVRWGTTFGGALTGTHFVANVDHGLSVNNNTMCVGSSSRTTTSYEFKTVRTSDGAAVDCDLVGVTIFGLLASPNSQLP